MAFASPASPSIMPRTADNATAAAESDSQTLWDYMTNRRSRKQLSLFFLGAGLFTFSSVITRRSLSQRHRITLPAFYRPSNAPQPPVNGPMEALQALQIATLNVCSSMMMLGGGLLWAFDISSVTDLRRKIRGGLGMDASGNRTERDVEEEFEEWLANTLNRRKDKEERGQGEGSAMENDVERPRKTNERAQRR